MIPPIQTLEKVTLGCRCSASSDDEVSVLITLQIVAQHGSEPRVTGSIREMFCAVLTRQIVLDRWADGQRCPSPYPPPPENNLTSDGVAEQERERCSTMSWPQDWARERDRESERKQVRERERASETAEVKLYPGRPWCARSIIQNCASDWVARGRAGVWLPAQTRTLGRNAAEEIYEPRAARGF